MKTCSVEGCESHPEIKSMCNKHYMQDYAKRRRAAGGKKLGTDVAKWLSDRVAFDSDECLIWPFARNKAGYPNMSYNGGYAVASRVMCIMAHGEPPKEGMHAAHSCGNGMGGCVNPRHLRWATAKENAADKIVHGTTNRGEMAANAKRTWDMVRKIKDDLASMRNMDIAKKYGVSRQFVSSIKHGRKWAHDPKD